MAKTRDELIRLTPDEAKEVTALLERLWAGLGDAARTKRTELFAEAMELDDLIKACFPRGGVASQSMATAGAASPSEPSQPATPPEPQPSVPATMSRADVARALRASVSTIQRMEKEGRLPPAMKTGTRQRRHLVSDVNAFIEQLRQDRDRQHRGRRQLH